MQVLVVDDGGVAKAAARVLREAGEPAKDRDGGQPTRKGPTLMVGRGMTLEISGRKYPLTNIETVGDRKPPAVESFEFQMDLSEEITLKLKDWAGQLTAGPPLTDMDSGYRRFEKRRRDGTYRRGRR